MYTRFTRIIDLLSFWVTSLLTFVSEHSWLNATTCCDRLYQSQEYCIEQPVHVQCIPLVFPTPTVFYSTCQSTCQSESWRPSKAYDRGLSDHTGHSWQQQFFRAIWHYIWSKYRSFVRGLGQWKLVAWLSFWQTNPFSIKFLGSARVGIGFILVGALIPKYFLCNAKHKKKTVFKNITLLVF